MTDKFLTRRTYPGREVIDVGTASRAHIAIERDPKFLQVRIHFADVPESSAWCREIKLRICADSSSMMEMEVEGLRASTWHMAAGLFPAKSGDVFSAMMAVIYDQIVRCANLPYEAQLDMRLVYENSGRHSEPCQTESSSSVVSSMRIVGEALRDAAVHATQLCDPALLRVVRRFSPCVRWWMYKTLASDPSGRLSQLATCVPGALVFAFALQENEATASVGAGLLDGAVKGMQVNHLLTDAVSNWSSAAADWITEEEPRLARPWLRILDAGNQERRRINASQKILVRRAGPRSPPTLVLLPPPILVIPEHIPTTVYANARWFRTLKSRAELLAPYPDQDENILREFTHFASYHAQVIHGRNKARVRKRMGQIIDYVLAVGRHTSRKTCPKLLLKETAQWHRTVHENLELGNLPGLETEFPVSLPDSWSNDRVLVARIRTIGELLREGQLMRNCLKTRTKAALQGRCTLFSLRVDGKKLSVELTHLQPGRAFVSEIVGFANREVTQKELAALKPWLATVGALS